MAKFAKKKITKDKAQKEEEKKLSEEATSKEAKVEKTTEEKAPELEETGKIGRFIVRHFEEEMSSYDEALNKKILTHLKKLGLLDDESVATVIEEHMKTGNNIADIIVAKNYLKPKEVGQAIAVYFRTTYVPLKSAKVPLDTILLIDEKVAKEAGVISYEATDTEVHLAMVNPADEKFIKKIEEKLGKKTVVNYTTPEDVRKALRIYKQKADESVDHLIEKASQNIQNLSSLNSISTIFDTLVLMAYTRNASDIHVEPFEDEILVRFRVDGVLSVITSLPVSFLETLVNHVKVLSKLRTDEHSSAQDGRFKITYGATVINFRVSILPTYNGEKIVLRLLTSETQELTLEELGYDFKDRELIERNMNKTNGLILVTGPTGSGKTTTLYAVLKDLQSDAINISTIEDPIEYGLKGLNQIQVNPKTNLTYADGLKSLLRQDPDVLMVGEIRNLDTAKIAVHASLTGHVVFSTLHTNNAALAPVRLAQMGLDPYLIVSTLNLIVAQRLVRKICSDCKVSYKLPKKDIKEFKAKFLHGDQEKALFENYFAEGAEMRLFKGKGCTKCGHTGYRGRTVVAEVMELNDEIRNLITSAAKQSDIEAAALKNGMTQMLEDGLKKVIAGSTTIDELFRVLNQ